jgi:hypothetical protein
MLNSVMLNMAVSSLGTLDVLLFLTLFSYFYITYIKASFMLLIEVVSVHRNNIIYIIYILYT